MKKYFILPFFLMTVVAYGQPDLQKLIKQESSVNSNWIDQFKQVPQWDLVATVMVNVKSGNIIMDSANSKKFYYRFTADSVSSNLPANGAVTYFARQHTFYINQAASTENQQLFLYSPFRIHYLDNSYAIVERIYRNYDVYTGRILTDEEAQILFAAKPGSRETDKKEEQRHFELWSLHGR